MVATGPDFKTHYVDELPASNADIAPTLMRVLELQPNTRGTLIGRVLEEALQGSAVPGGAARRCLAMSGPAADGRRTLLEYQRLDGRLYLDQAQFRPSVAVAAATPQEILLARAKALELDTPLVPPPGDPLEHYAAGFAQIMCSAVFITGLEPQFAAENVGYFTAPSAQRSKLGRPVIDRVAK